MEMKSILRRLTAPCYTRRNLELVLGSVRRTLDYRISKLIDDNILERIKPGFYLNKSLLEKTTKKGELLEYVGSVAKYPSYVSLQYGLAKYGMIAESIYGVTYVTLKKPGEYRAGSVVYKYRNIKKDLFVGYSVRKYRELEYLFAEKFKALFDLIYLTPLEDEKSCRSLLFDSRINWDVFSSKDGEKFVDMCEKSGSRKMMRVLELLRKETVL